MRLEIIIEKAKMARCLDKSKVNIDKDENWRMIIIDNNNSFHQS